ncbi:MAG: hypothetical protein AB8F94_16880 [Saprospiraceae bacterium]
MKNHLTLIIFLFPTFLFSQEAFNETSIIIEYKDLLERNDLPLLLEIYEEKTDFDSSEKVEIEQVLQFIENPFRDDFDYKIFEPSTLEDLDDYIKENAFAKKRIEVFDYHLLLECDDNFPEDYKTYINDDKIILDETAYNCFTIKYSEKYPNEIREIVDNDSDGVVDLYDKEPFSPPSMTTQIVDATAQFLVDRVKEELLLAFFDRFLGQVDQSTELTALLPNTYFLLKNNDIFKVPSMGEVWMTAFEEDLIAIPENFSLMVQTHQDYEDLKNKPELQFFMMAGFIYKKIQTESNVVELIESFYEKFQDSDTQLIQMLEVVGLIRENLIHSGSGTSFEQLVSKENFRRLFDENKEAPLYFSALIYQQDRPLFNKVKIPNLSSELVLGDLIKVNFVNFTKMAGTFLTKMKSMESSKIEFDEKKYLKDDQKEKYHEAVLVFANSIFDFLDYSIELAYFSNPKYYQMSPYFKTYRPIAKKTIKTIEAGQKKDYGKLMIYSMQMMEPLIQLRIDYLENKLVMDDSKELKKEIKILKGVVKNFMYYGGFMVDVLSANSTADIKGIINKYAAPVGSYRVKRQSPFSVSLSSYPGLYGGWESTYEGSDSESFVTGVTAPIGLSLNWGNSFYGMKAKGHSFSLYAPIIDIGAAFSYRWSNSQGGGFPEDIKWEQIISPGIHAVWGIGNTPMALMLGAQYTPLLRKITDQNNELQPNAWRFGATISVDIPIFHFYRSNK